MEKVENECVEVPMPITVRAIADQMETATEGCSAFLCCTTGEIVMASADEIYRAEGTIEPGAEQEFLEKLRAIVDSEDWIEIPRNEVQEDYQIMERFCLEACTDDLQEEMLEAIEGKGAFRRFREAIAAHDLRTEWHQFRSAALREQAAGWLEDQGVDFED